MDWLTASLPTLARIAFNTVAILGCAIVFIRLNGLRSLSKMSSFDFVVTVGAGTVVASTAISSVSLAEGAVGLYESASGRDKQLEKLQREREVLEESVRIKDAQEKLGESTPTARPDENAPNTRGTLPADPRPPSRLDP